MSLMQYPPDGDDPTHAFFPPSFHLNLTAIGAFGYRHWSNNTVSNDSACVLVGSPIAPNPGVFVSENGTWINATWCDWPLLPLGPRGITSLALVAPFALAILLSLVSLRRLGMLFLPGESRFRPIGRRWQWYWALFACGFALVGLIMNVDVDRAYVVGLHIIISSFAWYIMQMAVTAMVWEAVRHWGSWRERLTVDPDPFFLRQDDRRSRVEFWLPMVFYFFLWMNFFVLMPRSWSDIQLQRAPTQTPSTAQPAASDGRFKAGAFILCACYAVIVASLWHSVRHYHVLRTVTVTGTISNPRPSLPTSTVLWVRHIPLRIAILLVALAAMIAYQVICAFVWDASLLNVHGSLVAAFLGGFGPTIALLLTQCVWGVVSANEDMQIIAARRSRGVEMDNQLGVVHSPGWWRLLSRRRPDEQAPVPNVSGTRPTATTTTTPTQMGSRPAPVIDITSNSKSNAHHTGGSGESERRRELRKEFMSEGPPPTYSEATNRAPVDGDPAPTPPPPPQIRSLLDI